MDTPNFVGLTIWGLLAVVFWVIGKVALKFFSAASVRVKLVVFICVCIFGVFVSGLAVVVFKNQEVINAPVPSASTQQSSKGSGLIPTAYAKPDDGWIYCGEYDSSTKRWASSHLNVTGQTPESLRGKTLSPTSSLQVFDRPPTFSVLSLRWDLGSVIGSVSRGQQITIQETQTLGKGRVWCLITKR